MTHVDELRSYAFFNIIVYKNFDVQTLYAHQTSFGWTTYSIWSNDARSWAWPSSTKKISVTNFLDFGQNSKFTNNIC
jgi:hypothetical protein